MYQAVNPNVAKLIAEGKYTNGLDYYTKVGQFEGDSQTKGFFTGTPGNDVIAGFGEDKNLAGVGIEASRDGSKYTFTLKSLGVGEIDTLIGDKRENGFYLGLPTSIDDSGKTTTQPLYIGKGTADYGLIRNFGQNDYVYLAGDPTNYIYKSEGGDFNIYDKTSDLIGVVQDVPQLQVSNYTPGTEGFTLGLTGAGFNEDGYLSLYPDIKQQIQQGYFQSALDQYLNVGQYEEGGWIISGTTGNDTLISWTQNAEVRLSGVPLAGGFEPSGYEPGQYYFGTNPETLGVGEVDILIHSTDTGTVTESLLGWFRNVDGTIQRYYVGQGDQDYALVKNFNKNDKDEIFQGGAPEDYTYEDVDGNLRISYQGDLVGIVEGVKFSDLEFADEGEGSGAFVLVGKPDTATPPPGFDEFLPNAKTFYVQPDAGNTSINNFNSQLDAIALVGSLDDYKLKTVDGNFQIFTNDGDLVAFVKGVSELKPFTGNSPDGSTYLVSSENEFFSKSIQPYFNEKFYFKQNPDVQGLIDAGQYTDAFDQYVRAGQFEVQREDTLFNGTSGNDLIYGIGDESVLVGVGVQDAVYRGGVDVQPTSLGVGEVDTLIGSPGENIFVLANNARINDKVQAFYIGNGDNDYAKIQRFDPKRDLIDIAGDPRDYTYEPVDGNLRISKDGDLIAIVEGVTELYPRVRAFELVSLQSPESTFFSQRVQPFFLESAYVNAYPDASGALASDKYKSAFDYFIQSGQFDSEKVAGFAGTSGSDRISAIGKATFITGVPVTAVDYSTEGIQFGSTGVGEIDFLTGSAAGVDGFIIGGDTILNPTAEPFYVGNGDKDYASISSFEPQLDFIFMAGSFSDYTYGVVNGNLNISLGGDLVATVSGVSSLIAAPEEFKRPGGFTLVAAENQFLTQNTSL